MTKVVQRAGGVVNPGTNSREVITVMNTIANNVASKLFVGFVAVATLLMLATPAKAATAEELQAMINDLLAQVASLQGQLGQGGSAAGVCPYTWTRSLASGATGADVMKLQQFLNADADTQVAASGVGSKGMETEYYGPATGAAVSKFQVKNGVVAVGTGTFGPLTMAKANALCVAAPAGDDTSDDSDDSDDTSTDLQGEASLNSFDIEDGDDTDLEEGQVAESVHEFVVEFQDGDAMITRLDVNFDTDATDDLWDILGEVTLYVDGDEAGSVDASDEDNWQDDEATLRFPGLEIVSMEDEETTITLGVEVQDNLDDNSQVVTVDVTGMRYVDGDDVTTTEDATGVGAGTNTFDISAAGSEDELIVKSSTDDPDAATLIVDDQTTKSDWYTVFVFDLDTDDSINDIELNHVGVELTTGTDDVDDVVQDAELIIDGVTYDDYDWHGVAGTVMGLDFDIDGDAVIDAGDRVAVELKLRFFGVGSGVDEGETIQASASTSLFTAEGVDDVTATGAAVGEEHTLRSAGLLVDAASVETETSTQGTNDTTGIFEISFDVTALEGDFYVNDYATSSATAVLAGVDFGVEGPGAVTSATGVLSSTADDATGAFLVREGETETFTLTVTVDAGTTGQHRVTLNELWFSESSNGITSAETQTLTPAADYRTDYENINAS